VLRSLADFLQRWADDIAQYGFIGALFGALPAESRSQARPNGRAALAMRAAGSVNMSAPAAGTSRLAQAVNRQMQPREQVYDRKPQLANDIDSRDADWGPGSGLRQRREPKF